MPGESAGADPETIREFMLFLDAIEDSIAAMPLWSNNEALHRILAGLPHSLPEPCGCRYYRRVTGSACTCGHDFGWHQHSRRCWYAPENDPDPDTVARLVQTLDEAGE